MLQWVFTPVKAIYIRARFVSISEAQREEFLFSFTSIESTSSAWVSSTGNVRPIMMSNLGPL
jgi:hypothetical protein